MSFKQIITTNKIKKIFKYQKGIVKKNKIVNKNKSKYQAVTIL